MSDIDNSEVRVELIQELRARAEQGVDVPELVELLFQRLHLDKRDALLAVLVYFRAAFGLSLRDALPLREWLASGDRTEIDSLLIPAMHRKRGCWRLQEVLQK